MPGVLRAHRIDASQARGESAAPPTAILDAARCQRRRSEGLQGTASAGPNRQLIEPLTQRELEILSLVCDGASNSEIGERIGVALPTVKFHVYQIFGKLGVLRRTQAVAVAIHLQLVSPAWLRPS